MTISEDASEIVLRQSISHWGLHDWPAVRPPRVGEPGHPSYPYARLAAAIWGPGSIRKWADAQALAQRAGVDVIIP